MHHYDSFIHPFIQWSIHIINNVYLVDIFRISFTTLIFMNESLYFGEYLFGTCIKIRNIIAVWNKRIKRCGKTIYRFNNYMSCVKYSSNVFHAHPLIQYWQWLFSYIAINIPIVYTTHSKMGFALLPLTSCSLGERMRKVIV